jgi:2-oxoacid:acceptor oxidoreductase delta subunit (pyruvate/2-ketoisovalerate family)
VERPVFQSEKCSACGLCAKYRPAGLATLNKADCQVTFDLEYCKGCGVCMNVCALHCITMQLERDFL